MVGVLWEKESSQTKSRGPERTGLVAGRKKSTDPDDGNCRAPVQPGRPGCTVREQFAFRNIPPTKALGIPASLPRRTALIAPCGSGVAARRGHPGHGLAEKGRQLRRRPYAVSVKLPLHKNKLVQYQPLFKPARWLKFMLGICPCQLL